jgi:hypothetical protein
MVESTTVTGKMVSSTERVHTPQPQVKLKEASGVKVKESTGSTECKQKQSDRFLLHLMVVVMTVI